MTRWIAPAALALSALAGCSNSGPSGKDLATKVTMVGPEDAAMNAAIEKSRATIKTFTDALAQPGPAETGFAVKVPFQDGGQTEHIWLSEVSFDGKEFHGVVDNPPEMVHNVKMGERIGVKPDRISDWMFIQRRVLVGGNTLRVLRDKMTPEERAEFDRTLPFTIK